MKITKATIKQALLTPAEQWIWDSTVPGFGARCRSSGRVTYVLRYRNATGTQRKFTVGDARVMDPDDARALARSLLSDIHAGKDPQLEREEMRAAQTVADLHAYYLEEIKPPRLKETSYRRYFDAWRMHIVPAIGNRALPDLTRDGVARLHRSLSKTPSNANFVLGQMIAALNMAVDRGWVTKNVAKGIEPFKTPKRQTIPTPEKLGEVLSVLDACVRETWCAPYLVKMLLVTGLRTREWSTAEWTDVSATTRTLSLRDSKSGARVVQLSSIAIDILSQIDTHPLRHKRWIFPTCDGDGPVVSIFSYWRRVRNAVGLPRMRVHDLRHTFASYALAGGADLKSVQNMLGHATVATTERYIGVFDQRVREAQEVGANAIVEAASTGRMPTLPSSAPLRIPSEAQALPAEP